MRDARAIGGEVRPGLIGRQTTVCRAVGVCRTRPARGCRSYLGRVSPADRTLTTLRLATTRDGQVDTGDEAGLVRGEPRDGCGYFVSTAEATKRRLPSSGGTIIGCHVGSDDTRRNGVDPDQAIPPPRPRSRRTDFGTSAGSPNRATIGSRVRARNRSPVTLDVRPSMPHPSTR